MGIYHAGPSLGIAQAPLMIHNGNVLYVLNLTSTLTFPLG